MLHSPLTAAPVPATLIPYFVAAPIRVGETAVRLPDLKVRFHDAATMYQPTPEVRPCRRMTAAPLWALAPGGDKAV